MLTKKNKKVAARVRKDRVWKHFLHHCNFDKFPPFINSKAVENYDPEKWRDAFERYQERGRKAFPHLFKRMQCNVTYE